MERVSTAFLVACARLAIPNRTVSDAPKGQQHVSPGQSEAPPWVNGFRTQVALKGQNSLVPPLQGGAIDGTTADPGRRFAAPPLISALGYPVDAPFGASTLAKLPVASYTSGSRCVSEPGHLSEAMIVQKVLSSSPTRPAGGSELNHVIFSFGAF